MAAVNPMQAQINNPRHRLSRSPIAPDTSGPSPVPSKFSASNKNATAVERMRAGVKSCTVAKTGPYHMVLPRLEKNQQT
ncbi:MAG: hypothetical protein IPO77_02230 [Acidobacteria bacterium]|nr:hypothetical protein [Acidobacteriota bacterium]